VTARGDGRGWKSRRFAVRNGVVFNLGFGELAVVLIVALVFLGPKMLPEIASGLGKVIREIRKTTADIRQDIELDDMIRGPLRELREAATLPPEELKRRDEAKAARLKAEHEAAARREREAKEAQQALAAKAADQAQRQEAEQELVAQADAAPTVFTSGPARGLAEVVSPGGTMIANPPPGDALHAHTPLPELHSPPPVLAAPPPRLPPPPLPRPAPPPADEATVVDLQAQLRAAVQAKATLLGRPVIAPNAKPLAKPPEGKKG
jgi:sec-independent protein translocase protein TatB